MYGFPKTINTKRDVEHLMTFLGSKWATEENKRRGMDILKSLRDNTKIYVFDWVLATGEDPDGAEPDYKVLIDDETGEEVKKQFALQENPSAPIHRLGLTFDEVNDYITTVEAS